MAFGGIAVPPLLPGTKGFQNGTARRSAVWRVEWLTLHFQKFVARLGLETLLSPTPVAKQEIKDLESNWLCMSTGS